MAKFGIAPEWGSGGRWFKSSHSDQKSTCFKGQVLFFCLEQNWRPPVISIRRQAGQSQSDWPPRWFKSSHSNPKSTCFKKAGAFSILNLQGYFPLNQRGSGATQLQSLSLFSRAHLTSGFDPASQKGSPHQWALRCVRSSHAAGPPAYPPQRRWPSWR